jgi:dihydroflavonol-4-reductase
MSTGKKVFIIGGTGFLGYHAAVEFLQNGWQVTAAGLPPGPPPGLFSDSVNVVIQDLSRLSEAALISLFTGHDAVVFAAGLDDRIPQKRPAYPKFHDANVKMCSRILGSACKAGIRRAVVLGSYFAHFDRLWPHLELARRHPYIRSRVEQERLVTSIPGLEVSILELPYIFGDTLGRPPLWLPLVKYIRASPIIFYMDGGTACITARTVGQAIVGAVERGEAGKCYPIGDVNFTWTELLEHLARADGRRIKVIKLPVWLIKAALFLVSLIERLRGFEGGLNPRFFAPLQTANTFIDPIPSMQALGFGSGDLEDAFRKTIQSCG